MRNKSMKRRILTIIASAVILIGAFSIPVSASDEPLESTEIGVTDNAEISEKVDTGTDINKADVSENAFSSVFEFFEENSAKILSALSFIASLITVIAYKSGLLPYVQNGVKALTSAVKALGEKADSMANETGGFKEQVGNKLTEAQALLESIEGTVEKMGSRLDAIEAENSSKSSLKTVLENEIDMLYDIFMAASMPQHLKERVGDRVAAMKRELAEVPNANEANA